MKSAVRNLAGAFGLEIKRKRLHDRIQPSSALESFHSDHYLRHTARRLEHLASLRIAVAGKRVLELGAGIGDHTSYYLDRGCKVTVTEARPENVAVLCSRFPHARIIAADLEHPEAIEGAPFGVVHCYGLLYHLMNPEGALKFMSDNCSGIFLLETCVSFGSEKAVNWVEEAQVDPTQAFSGTGCRPTRTWIYAQLQERFPFVYCPVTQPNHEEFPLDWTAPEKHHPLHTLQRSVFVASRHEIKSDALSLKLLDKQVRQG
jgi:SAM-dependent methyltransferase